MAKELSCGVIVTHAHTVLLCHVTGQNHWDIPKGHQDPGESYLDTAIRELHEEAGIELCPPLFLYEFKDLGLYSYTKRKNLYLYWYHPIEKFPESELRQTSPGRSECDDHRYVDIYYVTMYVRKSMNTVLQSVFSKIYAEKKKTDS